MFPFIYFIFWEADGSDNDEEEQEEDNEEEKFVRGEGGMMSVGEVGTTFHSCSRKERQLEESWMVDGVLTPEQQQRWENPSEKGKKN